MKTNHFQPEFVKVMTQIQCPNCAKQIKVTERLFGRKVKCKCGTLMRMPSRPAATSTSTVATPIRFQCTNCSRTHKVSSESAGKVSRCPCGTKIRIPSRTPVAHQQPSPPSQALQELDALVADFADPLGGEYQNAPAENAFPPSNVGNPYATSAFATTAYSPPAKRKIKKRRSSSPGTQSASEGVSGEIIGGALMMLGAVVWFVLGLMGGYIFFYPPILFCLGLAGVVKGVVKL